MRRGGPRPSLLGLSCRSREQSDEPCQERGRVPRFANDAAAVLLGPILACGSQDASGAGGGGSQNASGAAGGGGSQNASGADGSAGSGALDGGSGGGGSNVDASNCEVPMTAEPASMDLDLIDGSGPAWNWWVVTSAGGADAAAPSFSPPASPPAPTPSTADGRTFLHMSGSGLGIIDYGLLAFAPRPSVSGGQPADLSGGRGLAFDAKGTNISISIQTADTVPQFCRCAGTDCFSGYRYKLPATATWTTFTVTWDQFKVPPYVVNLPSLDPRNIMTISFGGLGEDFDASVDNLRVASPAELEGGRGD
jgi:hypothetical protein